MKKINFEKILKIQNICLALLTILVIELNILFQNKFGLVVMGFYLGYLACKLIDTSFILYLNKTINDLFKLFRDMNKGYKSIFQEMEKAENKKPKRKTTRKRK